MPREQYVRPPLVGREAGSDRAAVWRIRALGAVVAVALMLGLLWVMLNVVDVTNGEDPGFGGMGQPGSGTVSRALVP